MLLFLMVWIPCSLADGTDVNSNYSRTSHFVTTRDNVKLAVDVYLPAGSEGTQPGSSRLPVIFEYTPYHRSALNMQSGIVEIPPIRRYFLDNGYAYVAADMRGTGASYGWMVDMSEQLCKDAEVLIDWIAEQSWSTGKVGMHGGSYVGWSQICAASESPRALKAIVPDTIGLNRFPLKFGGIYSYAMAQIWGGMVYGLHRNSPAQLTWSEHRGVGAPVTPVIDEDGDGDLRDEIPTDRDNSGYFNDDYTWPVDPKDPPLYRDSSTRQDHHYFNAVMEHVAHPDGAPGSYDILDVAKPGAFFDTPQPGNGELIGDSKFGLLPRVAESGVAIYNLAGWWDPAVRAGLQMFATLRKTNPSRITVAPKYHQGLSKAASEYLAIDPIDPIAGIYDEKQLQNVLRWYDHYLKDEPNGIDSEPPVEIYVFNEGWRSESEWPLAREERKRLYLANSNELRYEQSENTGRDFYTADLSHDSGWGPLLSTKGVAEINAVRGKDAPTSEYFSRNRFQMMGLPDSVPLRNQKDSLVLSYTTPPLTENVEVTGHPVVSIWASSSEDYGDFFFYIEDVGPNGDTLLVTEQPHRAGFNQIIDDDLAVPRNPGLNLKPDLIWHGYREQDYTDRVFANAAVIEIQTDTFPTAWVFRKGHSIRFSIAAADWPTFQLHPKLSPSNNPDAPDTVVPTITVHHGGKFPSFIELPVIPHSANSSGFPE